MWVEELGKKSGTRRGRRWRRRSRRRSGWEQKNEGLGHRPSPEQDYPNSVHINEPVWRRLGHTHHVETMWEDLTDSHCSDHRSLLAAYQFCIQLTCQENAGLDCCTLHPSFFHRTGPVGAEIGTTITGMICWPLRPFGRFFEAGYTSDKKEKQLPCNPSTLSCARTVERKGLGDMLASSTHIINTSILSALFSSASPYQNICQNNESMSKGVPCMGNRILTTPSGYDLGAFRSGGSGCNGKSFGTHDLASLHSLYTLYSFLMQGATSTDPSNILSLRQNVYSTQLSGHLKRSNTRLPDLPTPTRTSAAIGTVLPRPDTVLTTK